MGVSDAEERQKAKQVCVEMVEGWYGGDPDKLLTVLHDDLAKRGILVDPETGRTTMRYLDKKTFVERAASKEGVIPEADWQIEAELLDMSANTASVKVVSQYLIDICQVARIDGNWRIVNVMWYVRRTPPWF